jgi:hypothetical protein
MTSRRLELALKNLESGDWSRFERLASTFLVSEFKDLRTVASPSGDDGRDAELFSPSGEPTVVMQYSITPKWEKKIRATVARLKITKPEVLMLIYVSNQVIGANWDDLKTELRVNEGLSLDIRDRTWFVERTFSTVSRQTAAEELAAAIVNPLLKTAGVGPYVQAEMSSPEALAAVTFLGLQWQDEVREKGLTKLAFEALIRAVLINTNSENRIHRKEIHASVAALLPDHPKIQISTLVDGALGRMLKNPVKAWPNDEFCLGFEELKRLDNFRVEAALAERNLLTAVEVIAGRQTTMLSAPEAEKFSVCLRTALDAVLLERSQTFAMAVYSGTLSQLANDDFTGSIAPVLTESKLKKIPGTDWLSLLRASVREILISDDVSIQAYMRSLSDAYTLMAFLKQTPDVQSAVGKMFSHGQLWLDTTVILPLISDSLVTSDEERGRFSRMIEAARDSGLKLYVTSGVIEEIERHMNRSVTCVRLGFSQWQGSIPYLLERYLANGRAISSFPTWLETFRGESRPVQDLANYLGETFGIKLRSLEAERDASSPELRNALQQIWYERYEHRREMYGTPLDEMAVTRLVNHDVECYTGVVQLRSKENASPFGYSAWWLTVDRQTFDLKSRLRLLMNEPPPDSPVMSADFLVNYLVFGPMRGRVSKAKESHLPLLMVLGGATKLTPEIIAEAENLRAKLAGAPERVIRRQVRDHLDRARARIGVIANLGMDEDDAILQLASGNKVPTMLNK